MLRLTGIAALLALTACADFPVLDREISAESQAADYPKLVALSQDTAPVDYSEGKDVIDELESRTASLWARLGLARN